jgi:hypothetical protein
MSSRARIESCLRTDIAEQFRTALLISADPDTAEDVVARSIAECDAADLQHESRRQNWRDSVVARSIEASTAFPVATGKLAATYLTPRLRPVVFIDLKPRICFVLRLLLGYSKAECAGMMRIRESEVGPLLVNALVQLQEISNASGLCHQEKEPSCQMKASST